MLPGPSFEDQADVRIRYAEPPAHLRHTQSPLERPDLSNLTIGELCGVDEDPSCLSAARDCISNIVCLGSNNEVIWLDADRAVAGVSNDKAVRDRSFVGDVGEDVSPDLSSIHPNLPVAVAVECSCPVPAPAGWRFALHEPVEGLLLSHAMWSNLLDAAACDSIETEPSVVRCAQTLRNDLLLAAIGRAGRRVLVGHVSSVCERNPGLKPGLKPKRFFENAISQAILEATPTLQERTLKALAGEEQDE